MKLAVDSHAAKSYLQVADVTNVELLPSVISKKASSDGNVWKTISAFKICLVEVN